MKVVFVSNYFNHHQKPFCEEMYKRLGNDFVFISTTVMREERRKLGYAQGEIPTYVYLAYEGENQYKAAISFINEADVVIAGAAPNDILRERILANKLIFRYSERPYKKVSSWLKKIYHFICWRQMNLWKNNIYMLCSSAYTALDYASVGMYKRKSYKWGYFPADIKYNVDELLSQKRTNLLLWCGRFIDWKHPDDAIQIARRLKNDGYDFRLNMIGTGEMEDELKRYVKEENLSDVVHFCGSMSPQQVRMNMEEAGIYLFTSDRQEGWGAVLNESMNSGCTVIASHAIGSVPYLLKDEVNGMVYESGNIDMLYEKVKYVIEHTEEQYRLGKEAYRTIIIEWNATVATQRLLKLAEGIINEKNDDVLYQNGPCSKAAIIKDGWYKERITKK
ncbi:MAG: glycosyltransferase [Lachnospiraceae bacterium]|nr:glycosyltransferase [Lachnospiraceae bacterium]